MRIVGGIKKGRRLASFKTSVIRPTSDKVRGAIFNVLGQDLTGFKRALDLFAGTGAMGIEALSRGVKEIVLADKDPLSIAVIKKNLKICGFEKEARVLRKDAIGVLKHLKRTGEVFDLIFIDAPYGAAHLVNSALKEIRDHVILDKDGVVVCEVGKYSDKIMFEGYSVKKEKVYGDTIVYFLKQA